MKKFLAGLAAFLGIGVGVLALVPQTSPFAPAAKVAVDQFAKHVEQMPDPCPDAWCARDPKTGACGICGPVNPRDGGPPCECR